MPSEAKPKPVRPSRKNSAVTEASRTTSWGGGSGVRELRRIAWQNCAAAHGDGRRRGDHVVEHVERSEREELGAERFEAVGKVSARCCTFGGFRRGARGCELGDFDRGSFVWWHNLLDTHVREELGQAVGRARAVERELDDAVVVLLADERRERVALACEAHRLAIDMKRVRAVLRTKGRMISWRVESHRCVGSVP